MYQFHEIKYLYYYILGQHLADPTDPPTKNLNLNLWMDVNIHFYKYIGEEIICFKGKAESTEIVCIFKF